MSKQLIKSGFSSVKFYSDYTYRFDDIYHIGEYSHWKVEGGVVYARYKEEKQWGRVYDSKYTKIALEAHAIIQLDKEVEEFLSE